MAKIIKYLNTLVEEMSYLITWWLVQNQVVVLTLDLRTTSPVSILSKLGSTSTGIFIIHIGMIEMILV